MRSHRQPKKTASRDWHPADVVAAVRKAGWSLRRLSAHHGYSPNALKHALVKAYPRAEALIAEAIGIPPQTIWPSRYHPDGSPIRRRQGWPPGKPRGPRKPSSKSTSAPDGRHVNVGDAG